MDVPNIALFRVVEVLGFYLPPAMIWALAVLVPYALVRLVLSRAGLYRFVWHRGLFNLALYVAMLGGAVWLGSRAWL